MEKIMRDGETAGENNHRCVLGSAVLASMQSWNVRSVLFPPPPPPPQVLKNI